MASDEQLQQLVGFILQLVKNIGSGSRMMQAASGNFNHLATMPVNQAALFSSLLQRVGQSMFGPLGGFIGGYAGQAIFGSGYDSKTGQMTSRYIDPVGLTNVGFKYNVANAQNQAYLNVIADNVFSADAHKDWIKNAYSSQFGITSPGMRTAMDWLFDPLQKQLMASNSNVITTAMTQALLPPGSILSKDQRDKLGQVRDSIIGMGIDTQTGLLTMGGFNAGAATTLSSYIASSDTGVAAGLGSNDKDKILNAGARIKSKTKLISLALSPLKDIFGNLMPVLLAKLQLITGQGLTTMSALQLKSLATRLHGTMAATNVGLSELAQVQTATAQTAQMFGTRMQGTDTAQIAMLNVQAMKGSAGFLGTQQLYQQQVTTSVQGSANSQNANMITGAINILHARKGKVALDALKEIKKAASTGDISKIIEIMKRDNINISLFDAQKAAVWLQDPLARRYGTMAAMGAGLNDKIAKMQAAVRNQITQSKGADSVQGVQDAIDEAINKGLKGALFVAHIASKAKLTILLAQRLVHSLGVQLGIRARAQQVNLQKNLEKEEKDAKLLLLSKKLLQTFVLPKTGGGIFGAFASKGKSRRVRITNKEGTVIGTATLQQLKDGNYTKTDGSLTALGTGTYIAGTNIKANGVRTIAAILHAVLGITLKTAWDNLAATTKTFMVTTMSEALRNTALQDKAALDLIKKQAMQDLLTSLGLSADKSLGVTALELKNALDRKHVGSDADKLIVRLKKSIDDYLKKSLKLRTQQLKKEYLENKKKLALHKLRTGENMTQELKRLAYSSAIQYKATLLLTIARRAALSLVPNMDTDTDTQDKKIAFAAKDGGTSHDVNERIIAGIKADILSAYAHAAGDDALIRKKKDADKANALANLPKMKEAMDAAADVKKAPYTFLDANPAQKMLGLAVLVLKLLKQLTLSLAALISGSGGDKGKTNG